jgi:thymidylate synthase
MVYLKHKITNEKAMNKPQSTIFEVDPNKPLSDQIPQSILDNGTPFTQYSDTSRNIINNGQLVYNERTGQQCTVLINADFTYDVGNGIFPIDTTRKSYYKTAIMELIGYLRGYDSAKQFRDIGVNTWTKNANETAAWLANKNRKGEDDLGRIYGVQLRNWERPDGSHFDQLQKVYDNLLNGVDDRGEILNFFNCGETELGSLRPCLYSHQFSLVGKDLYLNSTQRSSDHCIGQNFNGMQVYVLLKLMGRITGNNPKFAYHKVVNSHIYPDQMDQMKNVQSLRDPLPAPRLWINPDIKTLDDVLTWVTKDDFAIFDYYHYPAIKYNMTE